MTAWTFRNIGVLHLANADMQLDHFAKRLVALNMVMNSFEQLQATEIQSSAKTLLNKGFQDLLHQPFKAQRHGEDCLRWESLMLMEQTMADVMLIKSRKPFKVDSKYLHMFFPNGTSVRTELQITFQSVRLVIMHEFAL